jgi:cell division protein FtsL
MARETDSAFEWRRTKVHFGVIATAAVLLLSILAQDARFSELNADLLELDRDRRDLEEEHDHLLLRREHLTSPSRIRSLATDRFGMVAPDPGRVHELR